MHGQERVIKTQQEGIMRRRGWLMDRRPWITTRRYFLPTSQSPHHFFPSGLVVEVMSTNILLPCSVGGIFEATRRGNDTLQNKRELGRTRCNIIRQEQEESLRTCGRFCTTVSSTELKLDSETLMCCKQKGITPRIYYQYKKRRKGKRSREFFANLCYSHKRRDFRTSLRAGNKYSHSSRSKSSCT